MASLRKYSEHAHTTLSKYVVHLIRKDDEKKGWPKGHWEEVYSSLKDPMITNNTREFSPVEGFKLESWGVEELS